MYPLLLIKHTCLLTLQNESWKVTIPFTFHLAPKKGTFGPSAAFETPLGQFSVLLYSHTCVYCRLINKFTLILKKKKSSTLNSYMIQKLIPKCRLFIT